MICDCSVSDWRERARADYTYIELCEGTGRIAIRGNFRKATTLRLQMEASNQLRDCILRCVKSLFLQAAQTAACNRMHELPERLARWLLMCEDRIEANHAPVTQELLAMIIFSKNQILSRMSPARKVGKSRFKCSATSARRTRLAPSQAELARVALIDGITE